jgi:uncharacterized protein YqjF (DUF2071 family)
MFGERIPVFLKAEWRWLAMLNYRVTPELVAPLLPKGLAVDVRHGETFISVLGFRFINARVLGFPIPFHTDFDEVNLRFYVRREVAGETRRGVVFVKEIVPRSAVALVARTMYNEPYEVMDIKHTVPAARDAAGTPGTVEYSFRQRSRWSRIAVTPAGKAQQIPRGSEEEFVSIRHWGYTPQRDGGTIEYRVEHPEWNTWKTSDARLEADLAPLYGARFAEVLSRRADSAYLVDGSAITVSFPKRIA